MRALITCTALVSLWAHCTFGFAFSPGSYREARQNYYEIITNCEKEGGECMEVDFGTTDPPSPPETTTPAPTPAPRPTTRAPLPPVPVTQSFFWPFWPFVPTLGAPPPPTPAPRPITLAPKPTTLAPAPVKVKSVKVKAVKAKQVKKALKVKRAKGKRRQRNQGEQEREVRKRRQAFAPDPWDYLYNECTGGWEFDIGCGARGGNICCYSSNNNNY
ncbi:uncharacterized protein LOC132755162 [Ruditapes philippinarum]|uniref:uncharacterized protein LOC132755162 n=1 Tax=Ruditapes philippinarum TaxID=129788 RepID=UPI00295B571B|nr:uncharacterized protein LOC132755162 [Ruditapes philippinarum]